MTPSEVRLVASAVFGIGLSVALIVRGRWHPFLALLCGGVGVGLAAGMPAAAVAKSVQKGAGDILGGTGLVVALGLALGAMLQLSGGADTLARATMRRSGPRAAEWASLGAAILLGLPLFFETGLVLLLPIVAAAAAELPAVATGAGLRLMLSALAGLSVVHALVPPHPGPLLAVAALHADLGRTIGYGLLVALPTAAIAGPLLAKITVRGIVPAKPMAIVERVTSWGRPPPLWAAIAVVLLPVSLIAGGQLAVLLPAGLESDWLAAAANPLLAMLITCLAALLLLFGRRLAVAEVQDAIWSTAMSSAGSVLLAVGAGGALKQVLIDAGLADLLARLALASALSPLLLAWSMAAAIRLATGSATVATITAAGIMPGVVAATGASPEWTVLAIGAGSVFFSHVNDPGFWLVRAYLGIDTRQTFRTWSVLETVVSIAGLVLVLLGSRLL